MSKPAFIYKCPKCGEQLFQRRDSEAPKQSLGKLRCQVHGRVAAKREKN